ncbi:hypothetical protein G9C85_11070 [Halorubellus sp. JP-L1]|uniref:PQQ-dependent sugar dehydrogenase n=1 Tax=Halorubellus sp. JP-L1 TaxID=2715753 RepID=UPI0014099B45|nr:hypothetical protein [Halorubellus sp. JP-L1]
MTDGWRGRAPAEIEGETNPTLSLEPGVEYELRWENVDGRPHNVVIHDSAGIELERTELVRDEGETQTLTFTASREMDAYFCEVHPTSMRGEIALGESETETTAESARDSVFATGPSGRLELVAEGLTAPFRMKVPPGDSDRRFVVDQLGYVHVLGPDGLADEPFLDISDQLVAVGEGTWSSYDERGLLGLAFHPDFQDNGRFYVRYSAPGGPFADFGHRELLSEFTAVSNLEAADPDSERVFLDIPHPGPIHNAGAVTFGPDGYLYVAVADGSGANDWQDGNGHVSDWYDGNQGGNGQDVTENLLGSILRIDVDGTGGERPYAVPDDNPLVDREGLDEHYAWGLRNPWQMSFDDDGRLFVADPGASRYEEVNIVEKGGNYGWNVREGTHCFDAGTFGNPADCPKSTPESIRGGEELRDPIIEYPHTTGDGTPIGSAVVGGHLYDGDSFPQLRDKYVFADFSTSYETPSGTLMAAAPSSDGDGLWSIEEVVFEEFEHGRLDRYIFSVELGPDGELYLLTKKSAAPKDQNGAIYKLVPPDEPTGTSSGTEGAAGSVEPTVGDVAQAGDGTGDTHRDLVVLGGLGGLTAIVLYLLGRDESS